MSKETVVIQLFDENGKMLQSNSIPKKEAIKRMTDEIFYMIQIVYEDISSDMARNAAHVSFKSLFDKGENNERA